MPTTDPESVAATLAAAASRPSTVDRAAPTPDLVWRRLATLVLILAAVLFFTRLGARALWASEFRWAEIAREMLASHNYFWPTINGRVYYDKPLGSYWMVVAVAHLSGAMDEVAARLPCALAGLLGVATLMLIARRLYDWRVAVWSGVILATSYSFVFFSRAASADVETVTGEMIALALFLRNEQRRGGWWVIGLWMVMALTSLTKGLLGFVLPIMVIGVYCCLRDGWRELVARLAQGSLARRIGWIVERNRWFFNWTTIPAAVIGIAVHQVPFGVARALALNRLRRHAPRSHEPLFDLLEASGFDFEGANVPGRPTFTFSRFIPYFLRPKLDWIALRDLGVVPGSAAVVAASNGAWSPRFSDHDFVTCEIRPR